MSRRKKRKNRKIMDYWQSYSDMMAALLLVFILIVFAVIQRLQTLPDDIVQKTIDKYLQSYEMLTGEKLQ